MPNLNSKAIEATEKLLAFWDTVFFNNEASKPSTVNLSKFLYHIEQVSSDSKCTLLKITWSHPNIRNPLPLANAELFVQYEELDESNTKSHQSGSGVRRLNHYIPGSLSKIKDPRFPDSFDGEISNEELSIQSQTAEIPEKEPESNTSSFVLKFYWQDHSLKHTISEAQLNAITEKTEHFVKLASENGSTSKQFSQDIETIVGNRFLLANPIRRIYDIQKAKNVNVFNVNPSRSAETSL